jgi:hypothetical protein
MLPNHTNNLNFNLLLRYPFLFAVNVRINDVLNNNIVFKINLHINSNFTIKDYPKTKWAR